MVALVVLALLGSLSGFLAGLLGIGGGIVIVPGLVSWYESEGLIPEDWLIHFALGTSLAIIAFTSVVSTHAHHRRAAVLWNEVRGYGPGVFAGTLLGTQLAKYVANSTLTLGCGIFLLFVALQLNAKTSTEREPRALTTSLRACVASVIGAISAFVGIGGGSITVPFLVWCGTPMPKAIATSSAIGFFIAAAGIMGYSQADIGHPVAYATGFIYWPAVLAIVPFSLIFAPMGARTAHSVPVHTLKRFFSLFLSIVALKMLSKALIAV